MTRLQAIATLWVLPSAMILTQVVNAGELEVALKNIQDLHRSAIESTYSLRCRFKFVSVTDAAERVTQEGEYWRNKHSSHDKTRTDGFGTRESWANNGEYVSLIVETRHPRTYGQIQAEPYHSLDPVLGRALLAFHGPGSHWMTLDELITKSPQVHEIKEVVDNGRPLTLVILSHEQARLELWFDPSVNYLVKKLRVRASTTGRIGEMEVVKFTEIKPGVFFPQEVESRGAPQSGDALKLEDKYIYSDIEANQQLRPDGFLPQFPNGVEVYDSVRNKIYKVGADGGLQEQIGKSLVKAAPPSIARREPLTQTTEESQSASRWLLPVSATITIGAAAAWVVRRLMRGRTGAADATN